MLPNNEDRFAQMSAAAATYSQALPNPQALGGLLDLYTTALVQQFTVEEMTACFGWETLVMVDSACTAMLEKWEQFYGDAR